MHGGEDETKMCIDIAGEIGYYCLCMTLVRIQYHSGHPRLDLSCLHKLNMYIHVRVSLKITTITKM